MGAARTGVRGRRRRNGQPYLHSVLRTWLCGLGFLFAGLAPCRTLMLELEGPVLPRRGLPGLQGDRVEKGVVTLSPFCSQPITLGVAYLWVSRVQDPPKVGRG